jgi:mycofactocin precursor
MIPPAASTATDKSPTPELDALEGSTSETVPSPEAPLVEAELLVEEVSIDGMCGVY